jgi:hypothetical protein
VGGPARRQRRPGRPVPPAARGGRPWVRYPASTGSQGSRET